MSEMSAEQVCMDGGGGTQKVESGQELAGISPPPPLLPCLLFHSSRPRRFE